MDQKFSDPLSAAVAKRDANVLETVREALKHGRTALAFQPVIQAGAPQNVVFYEGLIRIIDPAGRHIPARDFIAEVENTELGRHIDCATLQLGLATLAEQPAVRLSINMSAQSIGYPKWVRILEDGLHKSPDLARNLILEMTEKSVMAAPEVARYFMNDMQKLGLCFALDNFGAGQTSLVQLRDFYFDIVKMDGQFTKDLAQSADNQALIQAVIGIAASFEMFCVAQNVETASDAEVLTTLGVDCLQGYHLGVPTLTPPWRQ